MMLTKPRDRILDAAMRLFSQQGIQAVGITQIIAEAGVAPMTVYRQFGGKDALVAATIKQWSAGWLRWLTDRLDREGDDPERRLVGLWNALGEWFDSDDFHGSLATNAAMELRNRSDHPAYAVIAAHRLAVRQVLQGLAEQAGAQDPTNLAAELELLVNGAVAAAISHHEPDMVASAHALATAAVATARG
jgi:AcrR family transcriptional regulator